VIPGDGLVTGFGRINGRIVYVFANDFTVFGGSMSETNARKICKIMDLALKTGAPIIGLNDSAARAFRKACFRSPVTPISSCATRWRAAWCRRFRHHGPCAGGAVYSPAITDFVFMVADTSYMFVTGRRHQDRDQRGRHEGKAGRSMTHNSVSGVGHFISRDDKECLQMIRELLSFLPQNNREDPRGGPRKTLSIAPISRSIHRARRVESSLRHQRCDSSRGGRCLVLRSSRTLGADLGGGFARLDGRPVGIVANQPAFLAAASTSIHR